MTLVAMSRAFPAFMRNWENYPSGRTYERVTQFDSDGRQVSIAKITDPNGLVEYTLSSQIEPDVNSPFIEFSKRHFGRVSCSQSEFSALREEMESFGKNAL